VIRVLTLALVVSSLGAMPANLCAQAAPAQEGLPRYELFAGYSYLFRNYVHTQLNPVSGGMNGWEVALRTPLGGSPGHIGLTFESSGHYATGGFFTPQIYHLMAGPQYSTRVHRSTVFVRAMIGTMMASGDVIAQTKSHVVIAEGFGGGMEVPLTRSFDWRVRADWVHGGFASNDTNQISAIVNNNVSVATGPVLRF
jgi:hypothetical protein